MSTYYMHIMTQHNFIHWFSLHIVTTGGNVKSRGQNAFLIFICYMSICKKWNVKRPFLLHLLWGESRWCYQICWQLDTHGQDKRTQLWVSIKYASSDTCLTSRNLVQISVDLKTCPPIPSRALSSCLIRMARWEKGHWPRFRFRHPLQLRLTKSATFDFWNCWGNQRKKEYTII